MISISASVCNWIGMQVLWQKAVSCDQGLTGNGGCCAQQRNCEVGGAPVDAAAAGTEEPRANQRFIYIYIYFFCEKS